GEALLHRAVVEHDQRAAHQRRIFLDQQGPFGVAARRLARLGQAAPRRRGAVDELLPAADLPRPRLQRLGRDALLAVVDEFVRHLEAREPVARLPAGVALVELVDLRRHAQSLSSSLIAVFARVFASTFLTMTAAYSAWLPSAAGSEPATTTLPAGTRP